MPPLNNSRGRVLRSRKSSGRVISRHPREKPREITTEMRYKSGSFLVLISHLDRIVTDESLLLLLVSQDDERPAEFVECHGSGYRRHFDSLRQQQMDDRTTRPRSK